MISFLVSLFVYDTFCTDVKITPIENNRVKYNCNDLKGKILCSKFFNENNFA